MHFNHIPVPKGLRPTVRVDGYSDASERAKAAFHRDGMSFLRKVASALGIPSTDYHLCSNKAGIAGSGEVTLHSDDIYIQLQESCMGSGISVLYRSCKSRKDYAGNQNNWVANIASLQDEDAQHRFVVSLQGLIQRERERKQTQLQPA